VTTGNQRHGLFIIHRHPREGFAYVTGSRHGVRIAVWPFRVYVDQAHLHRAEGIGQFPLTTVALVTKPFGFRAPVDVFLRFPDVFATAAKTEGLESHGFQRTVAGENHKISPGNLATVFLLDGPQQAARLVQVAVVGPTVDGRKALRAGPGPAATIGYPVVPALCQAMRRKKGP
jgi:hypothetical protein